MSAADLHTRLVAEANRRLVIARAATPGPWMAASNNRRKDGIALVGAVANRGTGRAVAVLADIDVRQRHADAEHIALHGPDDAIRRYEADLRRLEWHAPRKGHAGKLVCDECDQRCHSETGLMCDDPDAPYPCDEVREVAASLGIDPDGEAAG